MEKYICPAPGCGKQFRTWVSLLAHTRQIHQSSLATSTPEELICQVCGHQAKNLASLSRHYKSEHKQEMPKRVPRLAGEIFHRGKDSKRGGKFTCDQCGFSTRSKRGLSKHVNAMHHNGAVAVVQANRVTRLPAGGLVCFCPRCGCNVKIVEQALTLAGTIT